MLPEDELDFEDFGDLGDIEGPELTNEELEALEQELRSENASLLTELDEDKTTTEKAAPSVTTTTEATTTTKPAAAETQKENQDTVNNTLEEGETSNDNPTALSKPSESQHRSSNQQHQHQSAFNNYNNYNNNGFYGHQQPSMPMNNMFSQYPPFSNRIYVNPKFNKSGASQQMQLQQEQQRKFMELEAHRMLLMQRQMQLQQQQEQQEQQRLAELDQKRREAAENMKRKREQRNAETGEKRLRSDETNSHSDDRAAKRLERFAQSPAGGISIKGVAAAARHNGNLTPRNIPYQPPNERKVSIERRVSTPYDRKPSITSRLGKPGNPSTPAPAAKAAFTPNKNSSASITATPVLPIVTNGKSNTLIITGLGKDAKLQDIRNMANGAQDVKLDSNANSATVVFPSVESAVTFRRKYNRYQMGESHINISFQK